MDKDEKIIWTVARVIMGITVIAFTYYGFIEKQECDIDAVYLWCRLHPLTVFDVIGSAMFYGGAFLLSGLWEKHFTLWEEENTTKWNTRIFALLVLGIVLIWL